MPQSPRGDASKQDQILASCEHSRLVLLLLQQSRQRVQDARRHARWIDLRVRAAKASSHGR